MATGILSTEAQAVNTVQSFIATETANEKAIQPPKGKVLFLDESTRIPPLTFVPSV